MKKRFKAITTILIITILLCLFYYYREPGMEAFNKQTWSESEFPALMKDKTMTEVYKPTPKDVLGKVGIEIVLPDNQISSMLVIIKSYRLYKKPQKISILAHTRRLLYWMQITLY